MRIVIGEDEILIAEHLKDIVNSFKHKVVGVGHNKDEILILIEKTKPDMVLLDIRMESKFTGIEIGEILLHQYGIPFIYISAHSDKEIIERALPTKPSGYIIKPFKPMDVYTAIQIASDKFRRTVKDNYILVKDSGKKVKVYNYNILFFKSDNNYVEIHTKAKTYVLRSSLEKIAEQLTDDGFVKAHRSYIINSNHITALNTHYISINSYRIPISRTHYKKVKQLFNKSR